ncbi:MAG: YfgM family protein [Gammaproteobacteria bacterium]
MATYETDEETLDALKTWWKENGKSVITGLIVGIAAIVGYKQWGVYQAEQSQSASDLYQTMLDSANSKTDEYYATGSEILLDYSSTPYASLAALSMAKKLINENKNPDAIKKLNWILSNSSDDGIKHIARIRLARIFLNDKQIDQALELVKNVSNSSFKTEYNELRGDVYVAKKEFTLAKEAYQSALSSNIRSKEKREFIEMKLHDIVMTGNIKTEKS